MVDKDRWKKSLPLTGFKLVNHNRGKGEITACFLVDFFDVRKNDNGTDDTGNYKFIPSSTT